MTRRGLDMRRSGMLGCRIRFDAATVSRRVHERGIRTIYALWPIAFCMRFCDNERVMKNPAMNLHTSHRALHAVAIIAVAILGASFASAQVELYALRKEQSYVQTGDATVVAETFRLDAQVRTANAGDLGAAVLTGGVGGPVALTQQGQYWN